MEINNELRADPKEEVWRNVAGYEGLYQVSNHGRVKSLARDIYTAKNILQRKTKDMVLKSTLALYHRVSLNVNFSDKIFLVHRLVAAAFTPNPENKPHVNHIDGVKTNNHVDNLEWVTLSENVKHAYDNGLINKRFGFSNHFTKYSDKVIGDAKALIASGRRNCDIEKITGVNKCTVSSLRNKQYR